MIDISHFVFDCNLSTVSINFCSAATQVIVSERYRRSYDDIQGKFVLLFEEITELLENEESVTMSKLKRFLSRYPNLKASSGHWSVSYSSLYHQLLWVGNTHDPCAQYDCNTDTYNVFPHLWNQVHSTCAGGLQVMNTWNSISMH